MSIVAMKLRNGSGAKGTQEGGNVTDRPMENKPMTVPEGAKQIGEAHAASEPDWARWAWVKPTVWTPRMLTALEGGVKGGKWFSLSDKGYALPNLHAAFAQVKANAGAAGVDHQTIEMYEQRLDENLGHLAASLRDGSYRPQAVRRVWIPKPGSREQRPLGIPMLRSYCTSRRWTLGLSVQTDSSTQVGDDCYSTTV